MDIDVSKLSTSPDLKVNKLFVIVYPLQNLQKPAYQGFVKSISSLDTEGPFDVLPSHENFVSQFSKKLDLVTEAGEKVSFKAVSGVIEVANNVAKIFLKGEEQKYQDV